MMKKYMKPQVEIYQLEEMNLLVGSPKGVYGKIDGVQKNELKYGGYVDEDDEEEYDPD
jgi:hypothetical protein